MGIKRLLKKKHSKRAIALFMTFTIAFTAISWDMLKKEKVNATEVKESSSEYYDETDLLSLFNQMDFSEENIVELENERTKDSTTYDIGNGFKKVVYYSSEVRFETEDGSLKDYDSTLKETKVTRKGNSYRYESSVGDVKNYIPNDIEKTPILMENNDYAIEVSPVFNNSIFNKKSDDNEFNNVKDMSKVNEISETYDDIYDNEKTSIVGGEYVSKDKKVKLEYISSDNGIKENIILYSKPESNVWKFNLNLGELKAKEDESTGSICIYDGEKKVGEVEKAYMNDASNNAYSEDIAYDITETKEQGVYELSMTVNKEYLQSEDRQYPIIIDPTITWTGSTNIDDVYILNGEKYKDTNFYNDSVKVLAVGDSSQGVYRTYVNIEKLITKIKGYSVASAKLVMYEASGSSKGQVVEAYRVKEAYDKKKITWNTRASYDTKTLASIVSTGKTGKSSSFDMTSYVRNLSKEKYPNYGIMLKAKDDDKSSKFTKFYSARSTSSAYRPRLEVIYYDKPTTATSVTLDKRFIKPGEALTVSWDGINSAALSLVQYRLANYDLINHKEISEAIAYSNDTKIGSSSIGSKVLNEAKKWKEGEYKLVVRGYDKFKTGGTGKGISFVIDGTKPVIGDVKITGDNSEGDGLLSENYASVLPTIEWSGANDKYFKEVQYSINDGKYTKLSNKTSGKVTLKNNAINVAGEYRINIRAIDKAGNASDTKSFVYYYDGQKPVINTFTTVPVEKGNIKTPLIIWNITEDNIKSIEYSVNNGEYKNIGTDNKGSFVLEDGAINNEDMYKIKLRARDKADNVSDEKEISYTYSADVIANNNIVVVPSSAKETYTNLEPTVVVTDLGELSKVNVEYKLSLNGAVVAEKSVNTEVIKSVASIIIDKENLKESGKYTLEIKVKDEQNNEIITSSSDYMYDVSSPIINGETKVKRINNEYTVSIAAVKDEVSGLADSIEYMIVPSNIDTSDLNVFDKSAKVTINEQSMSFNLGEEIKALEDNICKILVRVKDNAGNVSKVQETVLYKMSTKYTGDESIEAGFNEDTGNIDISWKERDDLSEVKLYARYGNGSFKLVNEMEVTSEDTIIITSVKDIKTYVDYRILFTYKDGRKSLSDIVSMEKVKDDIENESNDETITYDVTYIDKDEDGLADGYEVWDFGTDISKKDTDGDGYDDRYEVTTLGTNPTLKNMDDNKDSDNDGLLDKHEYECGTDPYLQDSDFDGILDGQDSKPYKTDTKSGKEVKYTLDVHIGEYDKKIETIERDGSKTITIENIYTGKIKQINSDGDITAYFYDSNDNNTAVIGMANGEYVANTYTYDKDSNLTYLSHNGFGYDFKYDEAGNMKEILTANRTLVSYKYNKVSSDNEDEEATMSHMRYGNNYEYSYEYDENGNVTVEKIDNIVAFEMSYDENDNMIKQVDKLNNITYEYEYDGEGNVKSVKGSDGFNISYVNKANETYTDESGNSITKAEYGTGYVDGDVTRVCNTVFEDNKEDNIATTTTLLINMNKLEYVVNENSNTETKIIKNKDGKDIIYTVTSSNDDGSREIRDINGTSLTYEFDKNDNIASIISSDDTTVTYEYDELEQLVRENDSRAGTTTIYSYDKGGNIVSVSVYNYTTGEVSGTPIKVKKYDYKDSEWRDLLTSYNGQAITYDEIGNPLQYRDGYNFTWTNGRSLKTVTKGDLHTSYKYNRDGIRTEKTVNGKITKYALESGVIVKETSEDKTIWYIYDGNGDLVGFELNGTSYYYNKNLQGDIIGIVDTDGIEVASYRYDAWGSVIAIGGNEEIAKENPFRYRGYYYDEEIGMYYLNSRYYDSEVGRFINADDVNLIPVMQSGIKGTNLFEYCNNNAVNMEDHLGKWPSKKTVIKKLKRIASIIMSGFLAILGAIGNIEVFYKYFVPKRIKQKYTRLYVKNKFVNAVRYVRWRWNSFKAAIRSIRINWKIGVALLATVIITAYIVVVNNIKAK